MTTMTIQNAARGIKVMDLYRWGYQQHRGISFITNVIQCHMSRKAEKMRGLYNLVAAGHEVSSGNTLDLVTIDGAMVPIGRLEEYAAGSRTHSLTAECVEAGTDWPSSGWQDRAQNDPRYME